MFGDNREEIRQLQKEWLELGEEGRTAVIRDNEERNRRQCEYNAGFPTHEEQILTTHYDQMPEVSLREQVAASKRRTQA